MGARPSILCVVLLLWGTTASGGTGETRNPGSSCEPAPSDEFVARTVLMTDRGSTVDVTVVLRLVPAVDVPLARVRASLDDGSGRDEALGVPDKLVSLRRSEAQKLRYQFGLEKGKLHHLLFKVRSEDSAGSPYEARTYLRVNLDPDIEPEDLGDLLQYRLGTRRGVTQ
jgi:hypothetical protein